MTTRAPDTAASEASIACILSAVSGTAEVISARTTWWKSSTRCSNASTISVELVDVVVLDDERHEAGDDLRDRLQRQQLRA